MKNTFIALFLFSSFAIAQTNHTSTTALCARIGVQKAASNGVVSREVRFQLCTPDGQPLSRAANLQLSIQPLTDVMAPSILGVRSFSTDGQGRISFTYGGGGEGASVSKELHTFTLDGQVIATFLLEKGPQGVEFRRAPDDLVGIDGEGEGRPHAGRAR